jgi:hypothetical protein
VGTRDIDLDDDVLTGGKPIDDVLTGDTVKIVIHESVFQELTIRNLALEVIAIEKAIVRAIPLASTHCPRRRGYDVPRIRVLRL